MGSGSSDSSGPDLVPVGPIAAHVKDVLALVPSSGGSGAHNFQLVVQPVDSDKSKQTVTSLFSPFNTLNSSDVISFVEELGVNFHSLGSRKCSIIEEV
jgi:hypothetical protein